MYADDLLVIHQDAQQWKLKVNNKKSNIIIFSGNGQNKKQYKFQVR